MGTQPKDAVKVSIEPSIYRVISHIMGAEYVLPAILHSWGQIYCSNMLGSLLLNGLPIFILANPSLKDLKGRGTYLVADSDVTSF